MKSFVLQFVPQFKLELIKKNIIPAILIIAGLMCFYLFSIFIKPGVFSYLVGSVALAVVGSTALARANDILLSQNNKRWQVRRLGLIFVFASANWLTFAPLVGSHHWFEWKEVLFYWGVALTWLTTPNMPPWWAYITKGHNKAMNGYTGEDRRKNL